MNERSAFGRLGTTVKLVLALSLIMLPIGGLLVWSALRNLQGAADSIAGAADQRAQLSARALESLIARNALALRVAANAALKVRSDDSCDDAADTLAIAPAVARRFEIEEIDGRPICSVGDFSDIVNPPRTVAGEINLWIAEDGRSLLLRTGVANGSATTRLTHPELTRALQSEGANFLSAVLTDGRRRITLIDGPDRPSGGVGVYARPIARGSGPLDVRITSPQRSISFIERAMILLPLLMWALASLVSWWLMHRLLIRPLRQLQRSVTAYQPGQDPKTLLRQELGPASEIHDLRDAFVRAVARIDETERGMADALEGQRKLVREVHHRVKNNLQVVASLLSIHGRTATSREGKAAFSVIGRRVDALSVVHRNHFAELEENQGIALRALLTELAQGLRASSSDGERSIPIELDIDHVSTTQDVAVAVAFLVTEIVEYAMLQGSTKPVEIALRRTSPLTGKLTIGSSILLAPDADSDEPVPTERKQFERIIEGLSRQLRSPLDRKLGRYSVDLPIFPDRG
ncbi:MAG: sensor histidine kinase [Pseudomonadota bacterium]|nr:sensor histidine kinase [Pseudomonadota bacterium]